MTVAMLMKNTLQQAISRKLKSAASTTWRLRSLKPTVITPVPSDIEISRAQTPKPIEKVFDFYDYFILKKVF